MNTFKLKKICEIKYPKKALSIKTEKKEMQIDCALLNNLRVYCGSGITSKKNRLSQGGFQ
tara:strand:- start:2744 stop:2923 length:180 start_codon:yes stop_codon:yes gene_type:complete